MSESAFSEHSWIKYYSMDSDGLIVIKFDHKMKVHNDLSYLDSSVIEIIQFVVQDGKQETNSLTWRIISFSSEALEI